MSVLGGLGPTVIGVMWMQFILTAIFIGLRLYCRTSIKSGNAKRGSDDLLMVIALALMLGYTVCMTVSAVNGFGQHSVLLSPAQFVQANKIEIIGQTFCIMAIAASKAAVAAFQMRIYEKLWQHIVLIVTIVGVTGVCFFCALFDFVRCNPIASVWDPRILNPVCFISTESFTLLSVSLSVICAVVDFIYVILPWVCLWNLQMPKQTKIIICAAMSLGIFAGICNIVRAQQLLGLNARSDYSYETVGLILWSQTELLVTISTACIPTYRELWKRIFNRGNGSSGYLMHSGREKSIKLQDKIGRQGSRLDYASDSTNHVQTQIYFGEADDASDRGILRHGTNNHEGVKVTRDVTVNVESGSKESL